MAGDHRPPVTDKLTALAEEFFDRGNYEAAEAMYRKASVEYRKKFDAGHWRIGVAASDLGNCLMMMGRYAEAEFYLVDSFNALKSNLGIRDRNTVRALNRIIRLYASAEDYDAADKYRAVLR